VRVTLVQREEELHIEIQDWGIGFDAHTVGEGRFGLEGIRERARLLGGSAAIESALGQGARIVVDLPLVVRTED
jgi:signal transduction histidine kinase